MRVRFHRRFTKRLQKMGQSRERQAKTRIVLFSRDPFDPILNNHPLHGKYQGCRSINIGGDLRAIYREIDSNTAFFIEIGTHSQLYS